MKITLITLIIVGFLLGSCTVKYDPKKVYGVTRVEYNTAYQVLVYVTVPTSWDYTHTKRFYAKPGEYDVGDGVKLDAEGYTVAVIKGYFIND